MVNYATLSKILSNLSGSSFISLDTATKPTLTGGQDNPMQGCIEKISAGTHGMIFQYKTTNAYENMVRKNLEKAGKNPQEFKLQPRKWGVRIENTPFIEHNGKYYLEMICFGGGKIRYLLDGIPIEKSDVIGLRESTEPEHGVIVRAYSLDSIIGLTYDKSHWSF